MKKLLTIFFLKQLLFGKQPKYSFDSSVKLLLAPVENCDDLTTRYQFFFSRYKSWHDLNVKKHTHTHIQICQYRHHRFVISYRNHNKNRTGAQRIKCNNIDALQRKYIKINKTLSNAFETKQSTGVRIGKRNDLVTSSRCGILINATKLVMLLLKLINGRIRIISIKLFGEKTFQ